MQKKNLNWKWYAAVLKGKYNPYRIVTTAVNVLLIVSFLLAVSCGISMSSYAVPFLYGIAPVSFARRMHLSMAHWAFVLMGMHLGLRLPAMTAGLKLSVRKRTAGSLIAAALSRRQKENGKRNGILLPILLIGAAVVLGTAV